MDSRNSRPCFATSASVSCAVSITSSLVVLLAWHATAQHVGEHDRIVVLGIAGTVDERHRAVLRSLSKSGQLRPLGPELLCVATAELGEPSRFVAEPLPQSLARCQGLVPFVEL